MARCVVLYIRIASILATEMACIECNEALFWQAHIFLLTTIVMLRSMATITFNRWPWTEKNTLWRKFFLLCCHNSSDGAHMPLLGNKQLLRSCFAPVYSYIPGNPLKLWPWPIKTSRLPTGQCFCAFPYANVFCFKGYMKRGCHHPRARISSLYLYSNVLTGGPYSCDDSYQVVS